MRQRTCIHCKLKFQPNDEPVPACPSRAEGPHEAKPWGFANMDPEKRRDAAKKGARVSHEKGVAHQFTAEEARIAGHKGGLARHRVNTGPKVDRSRMYL